jgi:hypothetical protein
MSFLSHRLLKIKLFKPENSKNQAFHARPNFFGKLPFPMLNHHLKPKLRVSKVAVCCFSWGICDDFYGVKSAAGG